MFVVWISFSIPLAAQNLFSTLKVFALGVLMSGLGREQRYINLEIRLQSLENICVRLIR